MEHLRAVPQQRPQAPALPPQPPQRVSVQLPGHFRQGQAPCGRRGFPHTRTLVKLSPQLAGTPQAEPSHLRCQAARWCLTPEDNRTSQTRKASPAARSGRCSGEGLQFPAPSPPRSHLKPLPRGDRKSAGKINPPPPAQNPMTWARTCSPAPPPLTLPRVRVPTPPPPTLRPLGHAWQRVDPSLG